MSFLRGKNGANTSIELGYELIREPGVFAKVIISISCIIK